jgi:mono/diheme cytochrome c family protein
MAEDPTCVTEIPEHLLKRSKERRAAIGGEDAPAEDAPAGSAVEPAATAAPAETAPAAVPEPVVEPPKPVRPEVAAALARRKIPVWAMPVLALLPIWAYVYQATLEPPPQPNDTPLALGGEEYSSGCASCHGAAGQGISGPALTGVLATWTDFRDHAMWVKLGSTNWPTGTYGDPDKKKNGGMPDHLSMADAELAQVVLYERVTFGGMDPASEEAAKLEAIAEGESTFEAEGLGPVAQRDGVDPASLKE